MLKYYSADYLFPISSAPIRRGVVAMDENGVVNAVYSADQAMMLGDVPIERYSGMLVPGFVNTHCHLELSHLKGKVAPKTGLIPFIQAVMKERGAPEKEIVQAMKKADETMYQNGIQAVGDHVNTALSAKIKETSKIQYHTFVEILGLDEAQAGDKIDEAKEIEFFFGARNASITPHAAYSVSRTIFKMLKNTVADDNIFSIHNQESDEENKLFRYKQGAFLDFYERIGFDCTRMKPQARNSLQTFVPYMPTKNKMILVHNTYSSVKDLAFLERLGRDVVFCFCPKANLYIEDALPKLNFYNVGANNITLGTDSLASNDTLDILEELKTLHQHYPELDIKHSLRWATLNGAKALGMDDQVGSLELGKRPGLVLLENLQSFRLSEDVRVQRIV